MCGNSSAFHTLFKEVIMENRTYYYARVSTKEQNLDRQLNAFRQLGATDRDIVTDKESGPFRLSGIENNHSPSG